MRAGGAPVVALLLFASFVIQVSSAEDLYWEGEEDASNEFLEVKEEESSIRDHLHRIKRGFFDLWSFDSTTAKPTTASYETTTEDHLDEIPDGTLPDDDQDNDGSGLPEREIDSEPREKTLQVTFVVIQPYRTEYSNRDSPQFQEFSKTLADAVNLLFDSLPGTQRASLVRIQSRLDEFSCKVTLDIVTTGYDDTARITDMLRNHIRNRRVLNSIVVNDADFSATVIDPETFGNGGQDQENTESRRENESESRRESEQPTTIAVTLPTPTPTSWLPWASPERGDQNGFDQGTEQDNVVNTTPGYDQTEQEPEQRPGQEQTYEDPYGQSYSCPEDELRCDETRCVPLDRRCDSIMDCDDGTDEANCETCGRDDFRCRSGKCIEASRRCDRVIDCPSQEDEYNCECREDEFRCVRDGSCIESRKRCDGTNHCSDNSDEMDCGHHVCKDRGRFRCQDGTCISVLLRCDGFKDCARDGSDEIGCPCSTDKWQCDHGSCIKRTKRCDGRVDCPTDRSDERNCFANGYFKCKTGVFIPEALRCNRHYDCPPGDYSDEHNCPCGDGDFQCDNGYCIPASKHCDRTNDCQDGSDERQCSYGTVCMAYQYKCSSGQCVPADSFCNGVVECDDSSDERNCPCKRGEFECRDGSCINIAYRCDGLKDCHPYGEDEFSCGWCPYNYWKCGDGSCIHINKRCDGRSDCQDRSDEKKCYEPKALSKDAQSCPPGRFTCDPNSSRRCAQRCDGQAECDGGEDENNCDDCALECDGRCLADESICNGYPDCSDGSDELQCESCDGPNDFRCQNGDCINAIHQCNGLPDCRDNSDEQNCSNTIKPPQAGCSVRQFQCRNGVCINEEFYCDGNPDCLDNSDEDNCRCAEDKFQCVSGQCIPETAYCDGTPDCADNSDEVNCPTSRPWPSTPYPTYPPPTTRRPWEQPTSYPSYAPPTTTRPVYTDPGFTYRPYPPGGSNENPNGCNRYQWRCENGPCINSNKRCDGHVDCPFDSSDEFDCPAGSPVALDLKTYPDAQAIRYGGDVVFRCRDEGPMRAAVRWVREGGRSLKPGSSDKNGRLEMFKVTPSDSGAYICQAVKYLQYPGSELRVELTVDATQVTPSPPHSCLPSQATCGNGKCIPKSAICDGRNDCSDGSDEDACNHNGMCEPSEYQCENRKCVLKTWLCDSEDDCGDDSDEKNCGAHDPYQVCRPVEYKCRNSDQCIPKSFHCDGQTDCFDGSDEIGCAPVHVTKPPVPANVRLNPGDTLTLVCEAVGTPTPLISWRLNWRHVPAKCRLTSEDGIGTLTCTNMQPEDSGAYSCEAINNRGTTFAAPDSIVQVEKTDVCPKGYFNSEARSQNECIRCFCFGESTACRSADLFSYNMPTALGEGGTRLLGVKQTYDGQVQVDSQPITDQYYYQPLRNGATVTKLANYGSSWLYGPNDAHPYLTLPESYNGNQLTSYGGHIKYRLAPHSPRYSSEDNLPDIIIKGKYASLMHRQRGDRSRETYVEARLTPENWLKPSSTGLVQATREDIMMALDNIEIILLRADQNNAGVNITDFAMESAQHINVGLGAASLVEECTCPPGYEGLSCQKCASGFMREKSGPWLGHCVREQRPCPPGTYGDPSSGYGCRPCPCPLTNPGNQFARTCSIGPSGGVVCDCAPGYGGQNCEYCEPGYVGNPMIPGDSCQPKVISNCNPVGTVSSPLPDECQCKDNVQGRYCDQCKNDAFYLSNDFRHGCALCFCSGVSQQCRSSSLRRKTTTVRFNTPQIVDQVRIYNSAPLGPAAAVKYNTPVETELRPQLVRGEITLSDFERSKPTIYYWSLPVSFAGDKVTSYGGYLRYTLRHIPTAGGQSSRNNAADIQLISDNQLTFHYFGDASPSNDGTLNASVQFLEKGWLRQDGKEISREHFLLALADVKAILIKATYTTNTQLASLDSASIDTAEPNGNGPQALHVEQCDCPTGYKGTSCEDCAAGYMRSSSGLYLEHCEPCECNGHSNMCDPETTVCYDCKDNTAGDNCEQCKPGYERNANQDCVPSYDIYETTPFSRCRCDPRGVALPCELTGYCQCKSNVEGEYCDRCRPGTFGLDESNPLGCLPCYCSGATNDCHEASHFFRIPMAAPVLGDNYGGYSLTDLNAEQVIHDQFVPAPNESELMYSFSFPPNGELFWSLPVFPGNRVLSYGGNLSLKQTFQSGGRFETSRPGTDVVLVGDTISLYWSNPVPITSGVPLSYQVPLQENGWYILNAAIPASRDEFMAVLKNLRRVLVRATLTPDLTSTAIADVSMDSAREGYDTPAAKGVEVCMCPEGYIGTSCESCAAAYYKDQQGSCSQCNCNGHDCQLTSSNEVRCNCRPPYVGPDCSTVGADPQINTNYSTRPPPPESSVIVRITSPTIKIQEIGGNVNFTCYAQSRMTPGSLPVTWTKVGGELPLGRSQVDSRTGLLLITNLEESDSGVYVCQTDDGISTGQAIATLKVPSNPMTIPSVVIMPAVNDYYEGDSIRLECQVSGHPAPSITWQRASSRPLPLSAESVEGYFYIESAREEDSGEYRCIASNVAGSTDRTAIVTVRPRPSRPTRDRLTVSPTAPSVTEGQSTRVVCTGTAYVPAGSINWIRRDGAGFQPNVRSDNGVLYIDHAVPDNQGVYMCFTGNSEVPPVPVLVTVLLLGPPTEPSNVTVSVSRLRIPTGESGSVDCNPVGYPVPLIKWSKYQGEFGPGSSQRDNTLIISNAQEDDRGIYVCEGIVDGTPTSNSYVFVDIERRERPVVQIYPQGEQSAVLGGSFEFQCRVLEGVPKPDIMWDRGGGRLLSTSTSLRPNNVLRFENIDVNDEGEYTCSATNVAGTSSASAVLKVRSIPQITIKPTDFIQVVNGDSINVECKAMGYPEPMVSIMAKTRERDSRVIVPPTPGKAVLRITSASERDDGDYECTATSIAGTTSNDFVIRVDRGDGGYVDGGGSGEGEINVDNPYNPGNNEPRSMIASEGKDTRIECNASDDLRVEWRRVGEPLQTNAVQRGAALIIYNASKSDSGQYECTMISRYTNEAQQAAYTNLQIVAVPKITLRPKTQTVLPGQSPTVECIVDGDDIIDISWRPVDRPRSPRVETRQSTLIFHQIEVQDAGKYECFTRNKYANASAVAEVIVSEETDRETSESHENEQFAHAGAAVHLSCNVTQPNLRIRWTKDGRNVPRSVRQKNDGSLFIRLAQKSDSGYYVCLIQDEYGRQTSNYINLHIEGVECLETQFRCLDDSGCIDEELLCDEFNDCQDHSDEENCLLRDQRLSDTPLDYYPTLDGPPDGAASLVTIDQPRRAFRVGENVEVLCRANARGTDVTWEFINDPRLFVETRTYGDGSILFLREVQKSDAGVFRCTGRDAYGRTTYEDFNLEVQPVSISPVYPNNDQDVYTARLGKIVDLPCHHNLEQPVLIEWRREYSPLPAEVRANEPIFHIDHVTEADAGTYICRVSNSRDAVEARAILRVDGVVPKFEGDSWLALPTLKDAYTQFDIEISFKPNDDDGLILYTSENQGRSGDYLALQLEGGIPQFLLDTGVGPVVVKGDRPLEPYTWHTIRLSRTNSKVTMDVDNTGPFIAESSGKWDILDLKQPLYIGGVPDYEQLPSRLNNPSGFFGCVSMLILGREEKNIIVDSIEKHKIQECDTCETNSCNNNGVCQEARNERGYMCLCPPSFAGVNCDRTGDACRPGLCGPGKCTDTTDGYQCACPVPYTGRNCDTKQSIEYPAFTGSAYLAIKAPTASRFLRMSMKIKATAPVTDGIIMYCAESARGHGGFTSLAVHDGRLEFRYDLGDGSAPVVLTSNRTLPANEWTDVQISRIGTEVTLKTNLIYTFTGTLSSHKQAPQLENMPMFVGGVDDSIILNNNTGVTGGFNGCIKDVKVYDQNVDIVNSSIQSANVQECSIDRGDIPETDSTCSQSQCRNGGRCSPESTSCVCPYGFTGQYCERRVRSTSTPQGDPCAALPCRNGGTCKPDRSMRMNYTCDCPMRYAGANCQMPLELRESVGFNGNGYLELPSNLLNYSGLDSEPVVIALAFYTTSDGVLLYQREAAAPANRGDFILLRVEQGQLILDWDLGGGLSTVTIDDIDVMNGERHQVVVYLQPDRFASLNVDNSYSKTGPTNGLTKVMNADSNVYIGGIPERFNVERYPGLTGCIEQVELMGVTRGLNLAEIAVAGRNPQRCREPRSN